MLTPLALSAALIALATVGDTPGTSPPPGPTSLTLTLVMPASGTVVKVPGDLAARLRALRREYPTLAVLTEIIHLDERRVTFRATVRIDGETRALGHAAQNADADGAFVAAAERLAVE